MTHHHRCPYCGLDLSSGWHLSAHTSYFHNVPRGYYSKREGRWVYPKGYWKYAGLRTFWRHLLALMDPTWITGRK